MIEHLSNCHGEWNVLFYTLASLPVIGAWARSKIREKEPDESR